MSKIKGKCIVKSCEKDFASENPKLQDKDICDGCLNDLVKMFYGRAIREREEFWDEKSRKLFKDADDLASKRDLDPYKNY